MDINVILSEYCVPIIVAVCYCIGYAIKKASFINDKYIPLIMIFLGGISGILLKGFSYQACALGIVSGAASTGINQIYKQLFKDKDSVDDSK